MNNMTKIKRIKGNIIDVILFIVLICIFLCTYISKNSTWISLLTSPSRNTQITLHLPADATYLKEGDKLYDKDNGDLLGVVKSVENIYKTEYFINNDYKLLGSNVTEELSGISVVMKVSLKNSDNGAYLNGKKFISPGSILELCNEHHRELTASVYSLNAVFVQNDMK